MGNALIIVESPTKAKIIKKFLGKEYEVVSSMGHVRDLPASKFGVDIENNFEPQYEIIRGKKKVIDSIKKHIKNTSKIYLAMDEDREGEAIGWHLALTAGIKLDKDNIDRIVFHEITESAIKDSLMNPRKIDMNLVNAQQARRVLDRIVGYRISPLLSSKIRAGLSAGRVQSVGLKMIVEREKERDAFKIQKYYSIEGAIEKDSKEIAVKLAGKDNKKFKKLEITETERASEIINEIKGNTLEVINVSGKKKKSNTPTPFITSTLQQEAFNRLGFTPAKTMMVAQQLYEGIDLADGSSSGLITYMRTDSVSIAQSAIEKARKMIGENYGGAYVPEKANVYRSRKTAQEAHECIRPTDASNTADNLKNSLSADQFKLYKLIWERFIACQMSPAVIKTSSIDLKCGEYDFKATGQTLEFDGYTKVWSTKINEVEIPELSAGMTFPWKKLESVEHETKPPARFTQATLVSELEKNGIGRPSTYATILNTLFKRKYVISEKGALVPQEIGMIVVDALEKYFSGVVDKSFTAHMEDTLDEIAKGSQDWHEMMKDFYGPFKEYYEKALENMQKLKDEKTDIKCPKCGELMVIKWGRNGKFFACSGFPKCSQTFNMDKNGKLVKDEVTDIKCPKCGSNMMKKMGRYGKFLACSSYPDCRQTFSVDKEGEIIKIPLGFERCPECGKDTVIRRGPKGSFLACTGFPKCRFSMELKKAMEKSGQ
jgi:DNA topoisomerase-1